MPAAAMAISLCSPAVCQCWWLVSDAANYTKARRRKL